MMEQIMRATLVVLAAGMGSRFGGLKQIEGVGPSGEFILDYSVFDAIQAGFTRVVFIIREDIAEAFQASIGGRFASRIDVAYAYQEMDDLPAGYRVPVGRTKPWGTGQAVLAARDIVDTPFAVINADDFYGRESYQQLAQFLAVEPTSDGISQYALAGFPLRNTLSEHGHVSRGICTCDLRGELTSIEECTHIEKQGNGAVYVTPDGNRRTFRGDEPVSMNMWAFRPELFDQLQDRFEHFLTDHGQSEKTEFYLPSAVDQLLQTGSARCRVLSTNSHWAGMTYREDVVTLKQFLAVAVSAGTYPSPLFG
jgi:UTP-glucose-1-phosphate uridylyltransferase